MLDEIRKGNWRIGSRIATEHEMAEALGVSKSMVNQALHLLEKEGVLARYRRKGTFIATLPTAQQERTLNHARQLSSRVHVLTPTDIRRISMHWNNAALYQLEAVLHAAGLQAVHLNIDDNPSPASLRQTLAGLAKEDSRGLLLLGNLISTTETQSTAKALLPYVIELLNYPGRVVWLNRSGLPLDAWPFDAISFSPFKQGLMAGQYLLRHAVARVICAGLSHHNWSRMRLTGVEAALNRDAGASPITTHWLDPKLTPDQCWDKVLKDIARRKDRPAVVVPNDVYAAGLIDEARKRGVACPGDFCIISFDNHAPCRHYNITTVAPAITHLGQAIGMLICDPARPVALSSMHLTLDSVLMERSTFSYPTAS